MLKEVGKTLFWRARDRLRADRAPIGNAPLDPFGQSDLSPAGATREFRFLRASAMLKGRGELARHQDLRRDHPEAFFTPAAPPRLVLFVSHRWQGPTRPDPRGTQAAALRSFLQTVAAVAAAASLPPERRVEAVPSLRVHGVFQAANLLGNSRGFGAADEYGWRDFCDSVTASKDPTDIGDAILEGIGLWYDFACLPQGAGGVRTPEGEQERATVASALRRLHTLISASSVVVLRAGADDYGSRAWCVAELSVGQPAWRHVVLRTDLLAQPVTDADLVGDSPPEVNDFELSRHGLVGIDERWRTAESGWNVLRTLSTLVFFGMPELEADRPVPLFVTPHAPLIFPGQRDLLEGMIGRLSSLSETDHALDGGRLVVDAADVVTSALEQARLDCTEPADRVYAGLLMLYARHVGAPAFAGFYGECLRRYVERRTTRLLRYRESRGITDMRVWYVFADEPEDSDAWRVPRWARA